MGWCHSQCKFESLLFDWKLRRSFVVSHFRSLHGWYAVALRQSLHAWIELHVGAVRWDGVRNLTSHNFALLLPWPKKSLQPRYSWGWSAVRSCDIELRFDIDATHSTARRELALQIEVDVAWYHMITLRINLMNISAVTIFLARVVVSCTSSSSRRRIKMKFFLATLSTVQVGAFLYSTRKRQARRMPSMPAIRCGGQARVESTTNKRPALFVSSYFDTNPRGLKLNCTLWASKCQANRKTQK